MIKIPYEECKFHYITNHYDYHLEGTCIYNGRIAKFTAEDETDYQTMNDTCPHCGTENKPIEYCHCENAPNVYCYITELDLIDRIRARVYPYYTLFNYYIKQFGIRQGIYYWSRWKK